MQLILSRHGNTFTPKDRVVWTGSSNDLPLVEKGLEQAQQCARWIKKEGITPDVVYCSQLRRTYDYATSILRELHLTLTPTVDERLSEIDYGSWTGRTDEEVILQYGEEALENWRENSQFPPDGQWNETEATVQKRIASFAQDIAQKHKDETVLVISSNGVLRYFLTLIPGEWKKRVKEGTFAMRTGGISRLEMQHGQYSVKCWNENPSDLLLRHKQPSPLA